MIVVAQDVSGIRVAALELLEHSLNASAVERQIASVAPDDLIQIAKLTPKQTMAEGYYEWAEYIFWLRNRMNAGVRFESLRADEVEGLSAIALAIEDFERRNPRCGNCGERGHTPKFCPKRAN
jgi:hypothetical protein